MKQQIVTRGIVLSRTNFEEADRIVTILTPNRGKLRLMAKGSRREKSKLAGGIELFSVSDITFIPGRKEIGTLVSSRLETHYGDIVRDISRTMLGYELLKRVNRVTEDAAGEEYFNLLAEVLAGLNTYELDIELTELWFTMQLLKITGHSPKLNQDDKGQLLRSGHRYTFSYDDMAFHPTENGLFSANHIKLLRLGEGLKSTKKLTCIKAADEHTGDALILALAMMKHHIHV